VLYILTLNYNKKDLLIRLKNSLLPALKNIEFRWIIKDNGSNDNSIEEIISWNNPNIIGIAYPHNRDSYAKGMNFLFSKIDNVKDDDLILTLNNDIVFNDTTSIQNMIDIIKNDKEVGMVGAKLNYINDPNKLQHAGVVISAYKTPMNYKSGFPEQEVDRKNRLFNMVTGAVAISPAHIFKQVPFNEEYVWAFEDCDQCLRISLDLKKKVVYCGNVSIGHEESASLKSNPIHKLFLNQNIRTFFKFWKDRTSKEEIVKYSHDSNYRIYK
jgi:GT2 family glycosyltransferase